MCPGISIPSNTCRWGSYLHIYITEVTVEWRLRILEHAQRIGEIEFAVQEGKRYER